jgi:hypothetical protein
MMNYPGVLRHDENVLAKLQLPDGPLVDGHAPGLTGKQLNAYLNCRYQLGTRSHNFKGSAGKISPGHVHHAAGRFQRPQPAGLAAAGE